MYLSIPLLSGFYLDVRGSDMLWGPERVQRERGAGRFHAT